MKLKYRYLVATAVILAAFNTFADEAGWQDKWNDDAYAVARREFTDKLFSDLCRTGEDSVPIRAVMQAYGADEADPRMVRRLLDYDPTKDGRIERAEMYYGFTAFVFFQVDRRMDLDADEDGRVSEREHALEIPDDRGQRDEEGYVPQQRKYFAESDLNGDGFILREEIIERFSTSYLQLYGGYILGYKAKSCDLNNDNVVDVNEYAALQGKRQVTPKLEEQFKEWGAKDGAMGAQAFHGRFGRLTLEEQKEMEKIVEPFWLEHRAE